MCFVSSYQSYQGCSLDVSLHERPIRTRKGTQAKREMLHQLRLTLLLLSFEGGIAEEAMGPWSKNMGKEEADC